LSILRTQIIFKQQNGFSLVEALIAIVILSICLLATATMLFSGLAASAGSNNRYVAGVIAQGSVDDLMKRPFANVTTHHQPIQSVVNGSNFFTNWTTNNINGSLRSFSVNTTWTDKIGNHNVSLTGLRAP
jgi:prepilin-type N-terminal cleavage/methylation domain-containing protein